MNASPPNPGGWLEFLRRIAGSLLALLGNRFELFTLEWREERLRLLNLLVWLGLAAIFGAAEYSSPCSPWRSNYGLRRATPD